MTNEKIDEKTARIIARMRKSNADLLETGTGVFSLIGEITCELLTSQDVITSEDILASLEKKLEREPDVPLNLGRMAIEFAIKRLQQQHNAE